MAESRVKEIFKASIVAIAINVFLGIFKAIVGIVSHSIAITMDAINNFTDAGSSLIAILSTFFAAKTPDKKHPFGYGRTEYLGTMLIGGLILYAGISAFIESVKKIISPETADYSVVSLIIIAVAIVVKLGLTIYITGVGKRFKSDSLIASGKEAVGDVAISVATLVAALIYVFAGISVEAWLGVIISVVIIKAGIETLAETIGNILGTGGDIELVRNVKKAISSHEHVHGAYDLVLHNYGPDSYMASVHVEVEDTLPVAEFDKLSRQLQEDIFDEFSVYLTAIGLYSINSQNADIIKLREAVADIALSNPLVHQMHGFYADPEQKKMNFDLVVGFDSKDRRGEFEKTVNAIREKYPDYEIGAGMDSDFNEV